MKLFKKIIAVIMVAAIMLGASAFSASAASETPTFSYKVKSQTSTTVTFEFSYVSGGFNCFDVQFVATGNVGKCQSINTTSEFKSVCAEYEKQSQPVMALYSSTTGMMSLVSIKTFDTATSICEITFAKTSSEKVTSKSFSAVFSSCVLSSGETNTDYGSKVVTFRSDANYIIFDNDEVSINYKAKKKLSYKTSYSADQIKWESSNEKVATVDDQGNVKALSKGTATITATGADGEGTATCTVKVGYSTTQWIIIIVLFGWLWYI